MGGDGKCELSARMKAALRTGRDVPHVNGKHVTFDESFMCWDGVDGLLIGRSHIYAFSTVLIAVSLDLRRIYDRSIVFD